MKKSYLLFLVLGWFSCQNSKPNLGIPQDYLPVPSLLQKGIVNKYYTHWQPSGEKDITTDIEYRSYQLSTSNGISEKVYGPAFNKKMTKELSVEQNQVLLKEEERYGRKDTFKVTIVAPIIEEWERGICQAEKIIHYSWGTRTWHTQQEQLQDTLILDKPAKILKGTQSYTTIWKEDTTKMIQKYTNIYVAGLGLFYQEINDENGQFKKELVEQIPFNKFKELANHGRHRVAYIDPEKAMDKDSGFELCKNPDYIYDYYNSRGQDYLYEGGKRVVWQILEEQLDDAKLNNESGYLTFRFIVNCQGEAGRFITEQADLNFQPKAFNGQTIEHCYQILKGMKDWIPMKQEGNPVDAYYYLTFKMRNGKIIEILPL